MGTIPASNQPTNIPQLDPIHQAIIVMRCKEGCAHNLLIQSRDSTVVAMVANMAATELATSGIAAMVAESISWFPHQDSSVRHPGYDEHAARMLRDVEKAVNGEELPF